MKGLRGKDGEVVGDTEGMLGVEEKFYTALFGEKEVVEERVEEVVGFIERVVEEGVGLDAPVEMTEWFSRASGARLNRDKCDLKLYGQWTETEHLGMPLTGMEQMCQVRGLALGRTEDVWKAVAHPDLMHRHRDLAWLVTHEVLPVQSVLHARSLARTAVCPRIGCGREETVRHFLWDCWAAQALWKRWRGFLQKYMEEGATLDCQLILYGGGKVRGTRAWRALWLAINCLKWTLWAARTALKLEGKVLSTEATKRMVLAALRDYMLRDCRKKGKERAIQMWGHAAWALVVGEGGPGLLGQGTVHGGAAAFSYDVELKLRKGNEAYEKTKKGISLTRDMKMDILDKIAQAVFELKAYPDQDQIESVASALVSKHPCLREPGSETGYDGWKISIKYKLGNYRSKLRQAGCIEVSINRKRRNDGDDGASPSLKRAKRGEINHVPDHPDNHTDDSLEEERLALVEEFKKRNKNVALIKQQMELTFSLRRKEIVDLEPMVSEVRERWPALFCEAEIREEFHRITNKNLIDDFRAAINQHTPGLHRLYRARRTAFPPAMDQLLNRLDEETSDITAHRQTAALKGLPLYLRDSHEKLFRNCLDTDPEEEQTKGLIVGILTVLEDDDSSAPARIMNIAVILEEDIVLQDLPDLPTAFAFLFGLIYSLNLQYPKELRYTFETIQKVFMELGTDLSARVRSLKNKLLQ
ncbi:hypothetical protein SKAU_G00150370 [Synaphobranchus kaupii]|uniref:Reverse transcriptase zinc-binding domain-containing protein n=1 Tax=Synaphobranchus kaupii TaxID=118154 RepID=A0A9Q1FTX4_SYNKA|nr:hypothetical protein SKAU_G00150370 [Synaphobranchus kaupii]